uniref:TRAPP14 N-terminal domain-containing protein n=1 Tax=Pseudonaja textilis TaxID=8673 RepID=A0A670ZNH7_PSETE
MESQCDYFMYFPAVPFPAREVLLGEPGRYRALPRRNHLYLGETVRFLLVLRCRSDAGGAPRPPWGELAGSLSALASVSPAGGGGGGGGGGGLGDEALLGEAAEEGAAGAGEAAANGSVFRECRALLTHGHGGPGTTAVAVRPGPGRRRRRRRRGSLRPKERSDPGLPPAGPPRGAHRVHRRSHLPADHFSGPAAAQHRQSQNRGDRLEARPRERRGPRARLPQHPAGPGPFPDLPRGAGRLQGASEHHADRAAAPGAEVPATQRVREALDGAQSSERGLPG